jgi:hypothetical protein
MHRESFPLGRLTCLTGALFYIEHQEAIGNAEGAFHFMSASDFVMSQVMVT